MNPVVIVTHNQIELTKKCVESVIRQDIPSHPWIVDNGSKDGTREWAENEGILLDASPFNNGFSKGVNQGMNTVFSMGANWCLSTGNDTILPRYYYRTLLEQNFPVVSGVQHINGHRVTLEDLEMVPPIEPVRPNPDFSSILFRKEAWESLGGFDEAMWNYCSDCDLHIRPHLMGIVMNHVHVPFFHLGSATTNLATPEEKAKIQERQRPDWGAFNAKWGCNPGTDEYAAIFSPELFGIKRKP